MVNEKHIIQLKKNSNSINRQQNLQLITNKKTLLSIAWPQLAQILDRSHVSGVEKVSRIPLTQINKTKLKVTSS